MSKKNKKKALKKKLAHNAAVRGFERKEHFSSGKTLEQWMPSKKVHTSRAQKRKSRKTRDKKAIRESQE